MGTTARKSDPKLWDRTKALVTKSDRGGKPGQWSARKAQMAVSEYKKAGGEYEDKKRDDNQLRQWTKEDWGTRSGKKSGATGERYLPKKAREEISREDYDRSTAKKRSDTRRGRQFSPQPPDVARKTRPYRAGHETTDQSRATKRELYEQAKRREIPGRSRMSRDQLARALQD